MAKRPLEPQQLRKGTWFTPKRKRLEESYSTSPPATWVKPIGFKSLKRKSKKFEAELRNTIWMHTCMLLLTAKAKVFCQLCHLNSALCRNGQCREHGEEPRRVQEKVTSHDVSVNASQILNELRTHPSIKLKLKKERCPHLSLILLST